jgi:hypothetical protein
VDIAQYVLGGEVSRYQPQSTRSTDVPNDFLRVYLTVDDITVLGLVSHQVFHSVHSIGEFGIQELRILDDGLLECVPVHIFLKNETGEQHMEQQEKTPR